MTGFAAAQPARGYHVPYRPGETVCPGCTGRAWIVGRVSAECAGCGTALDLPEAARRG